jgi:hypothetical protein
MNPTMSQQLAALPRLRTQQLRERYAEVFGEETPANNRAWLLKRIAWRIQALAEGGLSERARQRAAELANDADLRMNPPRSHRQPEPAAGQTAVRAMKVETDDRLPPPGTILTRPYKGEEIQVQVLQHGFAFQGQVYKSLSAVAKAMTGSHCNGFLFFKIHAKGDKP